MRIKFLRPVSVDCDGGKLFDVVDRSFQRGEVVEITAVQSNSKNFANLVMTDGEVAIDVPADAFAVIS
jgi:hypothetical protein